MLTRDSSSPSGPKLVTPVPSASAAGFSLPFAPYGAKTVRGQRTVPMTSTAKAAMFTHHSLNRIDHSQLLSMYFNKAL